MRRAKQRCGPPSLQRKALPHLPGGASTPDARRWTQLRRLGSTLCILAIAAPGNVAAAAPYCLSVVGIPAQCLYADVANCLRDAARQGGTCQVNAAEIKLPRFSTLRFCLVTNGPVIDCSYVDRRSCDLQATRRAAICADRAPGQPDIDIFNR